MTKHSEYSELDEILEKFRQATTYEARKSELSYLSESDREAIERSLKYHHQEAKTALTAHITKEKAKARIDEAGHWYRLLQIPDILEKYNIDIQKIYKERLAQLAKDKEDE